MSEVDDAAAKLALRLRLMVLGQDAPFMAPFSVCSETRRIEEIFGVELTHRWCTDELHRLKKVKIWSASK